MIQNSLFEEDTAKYSTIPVNVSKVSQLSPFRYPGGKTWFVPYLRRWLKSLPKQPRLFVEPFAGGGICSLTCAAEHLADRVYMSELDPDVASVWQTTLSSDSEWLINKILNFPRCTKTAAEIFETPPKTTRDRAFQTILRNRLLHGGILAPGSRMIRSGENGKGPFSRWYPETLAKRLKTIYLLRDRIEFEQADAFDVFCRFRSRKTAAWFVDPPYTASKSNAGRRLYVHHALDHDRLFDECSRIAGDFLMTYDNAIEVEKLAIDRSFIIDRVPMKNTHHQEKYELVISRNSAGCPDLPSSERRESARHGPKTAGGGTVSS